MEAFDGLLREAFVVTALLGLPVLVVATLAGTAIAVLQAATQIQEQTIVLLPKCIAVGLTVMLFGGWGMRLACGLFIDAIRSLPHLTA